MFQKCLKGLLVEAELIGKEYNPRGIRILKPDFSFVYKHNCSETVS